MLPVLWPLRYELLGISVARPIRPIVTLAPLSLRSLSMIFLSVPQCSQSVREPCCYGRVLTCCSLTPPLWLLQLSPPIHHWYCTNTAGHGDSAVDHAGFRLCTEAGWACGLKGWPVSIAACCTAAERSLVASHKVLFDGAAVCVCVCVCVVCDFLLHSPEMGISMLVALLASSGFIFLLLLML